MFPRTEMLDLVVVDGEAKGITIRDLITGEVRVHAGDAVVLATGGYVNVFYLSTNAMGCSVTAIWKAHKKGAFFANPCYTQIHPTCIPQAGDYQSKLTLMSESLRNDGRIWVPKKKEDCGKPANQIAEEDRDYYLERKYPSFGNLAPRDISSRAAKEQCDEGRGVGPGGRGVYLDFRDSIKRFGENVIRERYGNLFEMYERITDENGYKVPMRIYPAPHYAMGGLWVDYNLMSNLPGLFVLGEANFSVHGANRLGASALMQGLADGYFVIPYTIANYLVQTKPGKVKADHAECQKSIEDVKGTTKKLLSINGNRTVTEFIRELGNAHVEQLRDGAQQGIPHRGDREDPGDPRGVLEEREGERDRRRVQPAAGERRAHGRLHRVRASCICRDALHRDESCGGHFRVEHQYADGEAKRNDADFAYAAAWEFKGVDKEPELHKEPLKFENIHLAVRSYK